MIKDQKLQAAVLVFVPLFFLAIFVGFTTSNYIEVRELFRVADEHSPSIVFIDEIDAIGTKRFQIVRTLIFNLKDPTHFCRYESNSGGEREIQRTMLELLNQLDGFDNRTETKVPINC